MIFIRNDLFLNTLIPSIYQFRSDISVMHIKHLFYTLYIK